MSDCGDCGLCCKLLAVDEIDKPACHWCKKIERHEHGRRCGIYPERPQACRSFECLWLITQARPGKQMQPELRPDRSHVVFAMDMHVTGAEHIDPANRTLFAHVDPDYPTAWRRKLPRLAIEAFVQRGGTVWVLIGEQRIVMRKGMPMIVGAEAEVEWATTALRAMTRPDLPKGLPKPILDFSELMKRRA